MKHLQFCSVVLIGLAAGSIPGSGQQQCSGSDCLTILAIHKGTRCGKPNSLQVDVRNDSTENLRGYIIITSSSGRKQYEATGLMHPGESLRGPSNPIYVCDSDGTGNVEKAANTGTDPRYPAR
jgi:hypothetical protein